jgi:hypothetical protein
MWASAWALTSSSISVPSSSSCAVKMSGEVLDVYIQQGSTYSGLLAYGLLAAARGGSAINGDNGLYFNKTLESVIKTFHLIYLTILKSSMVNGSFKFKFK